MAKAFYLLPPTKIINVLVIDEIIYPSVKGMPADSYLGRHSKGDVIDSLEFGNTDTVTKANKTS